MAKWHYLGGNKPKKSTKQLYEEMKKLEQQEKDAQERAVIEARIAEIKHAKRNNILAKLGSGARFAGRQLESAGRGAYIVGKSGYKAATSKQAKKLYKQLTK